MNLSQFIDPLCYLCLHGAVVSSLSLEQKDFFTNSVDAVKSTEFVLGKSVKVWMILIPVLLSRLVF